MSWIGLHNRTNIYLSKDIPHYVLPGDKNVNQVDKNIHTLFNPETVAIIGASDREDTVGHSAIRNLLYGRLHGSYRIEGYQGKIYAVNTRELNLEIPTYPSILDIPEKTIDLAVIAIPSKYVPDVIDECGKKGVKGVIVISAGFSEIGEEGASLEEEVVMRAQKYGIRILGPNCLGGMNVFKRLNATFTDEMVQLGPLSLISQSGALCTAAIHYAKEKNIGFSHFISVGDKADIDDADLLEYLNNDPNTKCIIIYVESLKDGRKFFETSLRVNKTTPIVVLKSGRTDAGARAAASHTGSIAGSDTAYDAAFEQAGVYRVDTLEALYDCSRALGYQPIPKGDRVAILTNSGGPGVMAADYAEKIGLRLANLSSSTLKKLNDYLPAAWSHSNPIDILGDATAVRYTEVIEILLEAVEVDSIVCILTPLTFTHPYSVSQQIVQIAKKSTKPILANYLGIISAISGRYLDDHGVPEIAWTERTIQAMHALTNRSNFLQFEAKAEIPPTPMDVYEKKDRINAIIEGARTDNRTILTLIESRDILETLDIPLTRGLLITDISQIKTSDVPFPVAMKIVSKEITHKTDADGVMINVPSIKEAEKAYRKIIANANNYDPDATIEGVWLEEMISGTELIIGTTVDPTFGKMIMFGLGGIFVEIIKDVVFRLIPIHMKNAEAMYDKIKAKAIMEGARGMPKADRHKIEEMLVNISEFVNKFPIREMDINPFMITRDGLMAIDARIVLE